MWLNLYNEFLLISYFEDNMISHSIYHFLLDYLQL